MNDAWLLVRWNADGTLAILGVFESYDDARFNIGDSIRPGVQIVKTTYHTAEARAGPR